MKQIPLTQGQFALVDDEDYDYLMQWKWYASYCKASKTFYALRCVAVGKNQQKEISMHRFILGITERKIFVDHRNHNTLDNTKSNIRISTHGQNMANRKPRKNGSSQFLGVFKLRDKETWVARIKKDNKVSTLGSFKSEEDAARAYDNAAIRLHGEFANLNFKTSIL